MRAQLHGDGGRAAGGILTGPKIEMLANEHCQTGESPVWDARRGCVYWVDIPNGKVFRHDFKKHDCIYRGEPVGGICLQEDGTLLLFRVRDVAVLAPGGQPRTIIEYTEAGLERFNDVFVDARGRVFVGTIGRTEESGGLYRVDWDGSVSKVARGTGCANGSAISPDEKTFYWTDSTHRRILAFEFDAEAGELHRPRCFYEAAKEEGIPDGMCMDADGNLWSARWDGGAVLKIDSQGREIGRLEMPVRTVSAVCFGGPDLDRLFVTTAKGKEGETTWDGALFRVEWAFRGRAAHLSRIRL